MVAVAESGITTLKKIEAKMRSHLHGTGDGACVPWLQAAYRAHCNVRIAPPPGKFKNTVDRLHRR